MVPTLWAPERGVDPVCAWKRSPSWSGRRSRSKTERGPRGPSHTELSCKKDVLRRIHEPTLIFFFFTRGLDAVLFSDLKYALAISLHSLHVARDKLFHSALNTGWTIAWIKFIPPLEEYPPTQETLLSWQVWDSFPVGPVLTQPPPKAEGGFSDKGMWLSPSVSPCSTWMAASKELHFFSRDWKWRQRKYNNNNNNNNNNTYLTEIGSVELIACK